MPCITLDLAICCNTPAASPAATEMETNAKNHHGPSVVAVNWTIEAIHLIILYFMVPLRRRRVQNLHRQTRHISPSVLGFSSSQPYPPISPYHPTCWTGHLHDLEVPFREEFQDSENPGGHLCRDQELPQVG